MALTMSRTRTQSTLTKLSTMIANVHGELAFVDTWLADGAGVPAMLEPRRKKLLADRDALYATVRQFDPCIEPERIGAAEGWQSAYGRGGARRKLTVRTLRARYSHAVNLLVAC